MDNPVTSAERTPRWWMWRTLTLILWSVGLAALTASTGDDRFTAKLVLIFFGLLLLIHAVMFITVRVLDRIGRS